MPHNNLARGYAAEAFVECVLLENHLTSHKPSGNYCPYDLVVILDGVPIKIQVKCANEKGKFDIRSTSNKKHKTQPRLGDYDVIAVVDLSKRDVYFIPAKALITAGYKIPANIKTQEMRQWKNNTTAITESTQVVLDYINKQHNYSSNNSNNGRYTIYVPYNDLVADNSDSDTFQVKVTTVEPTGSTDIMPVGPEDKHNEN